MNWTRREKALLAFALTPWAAIALLLWMAFPPLQAERRFSATYDSAELCSAAGDAAKAWAGYGFYGRAAEWADRARVQCAMARLMSLP